MPEEMNVVTETESGTKSVRAKVERLAAPDFRSIYTNSARIAVSLFELRILFGEVVEVNEEQVRVIDHIAINMSPEHAQALYKLLGEQLTIYRKRFGELRPTTQPSA